MQMPDVKNTIVIEKRSLIISWPIGNSPEKKWFYQSVSFCHKREHQESGEDQRSP